MTHSAISGGSLAGDTRTPCCHRPIWRRMRSITSPSSIKDTMRISFWHFGQRSGSASHTFLMSSRHLAEGWPGSPNWSSSYVSPGTRLQVEYLSSIDVLSRSGRREGVARPERPSGCVLAKLLGVSNPRLLWGRSSLYSRRQSSSTTLASVNVQSCSRSRPSSRKRA